MNLKEAEITTMSTDDEMPRMSVASWYINRIVFDGTLTANIVAYVVGEGAAVATNMISVMKFR